MIILDCWWEGYGVYHCRDFFLHWWDTYKQLPWSVLAHSTHLRGAGTYDNGNGERSRVQVTLATGVPEDAVHAAYRADPDTLVVPDAGEILLRLR